MEWDGMGWEKEPVIIPYPKNTVYTVCYRSGLQSYTGISENITYDTTDSRPACTDTTSINHVHSRSPYRSTRTALASATLLLNENHMNPDNEEKRKERKKVPYRHSNSTFMTLICSSTRYDILLLPKEVQYIKTYQDTLHTNPIGRPIHRRALLRHSRASEPIAST